LGIGTSKEGSSSGRRQGDYKFSRLDLERKALQNSTETYKDDPEDLESYRKWKRDVFSSEKESPGSLIEHSPVLREMHARLVPDDVSEEDFWSRYLFKLHVMEDRHTLIAKAAARTGDESGDFEWEDETEPSPQVPPQLEPEARDPVKEKIQTEHRDEDRIIKEEEEKKEEKEEEIEKSEEQQRDPSPCDTTDDDEANTRQEEKAPSSSSLVDEDSWTDMGSTVSAPANEMPTKLDCASTDDIDIIDDEDVANWE